MPFKWTTCPAAPFVQSAAVLEKESFFPQDIKSETETLPFLIGVGASRGKGNGDEPGSFGVHPTWNLDCTEQHLGSDARPFLAAEASSSPSRFNVSTPWWHHFCRPEPLHPLNFVCRPRSPASGMPGTLGLCPAGWQLKRASLTRALYDSATHAVLLG